MQGRALIAAAVIACSSPLLIHAQEASQESVEYVTSVANQGVLRAGTAVQLRMIEAVASNTHKRGDRFSMEVAEPVIVDGREWIPVGAPATGEVIEALKSGMGGNPGRLILAARFVIANDSKIALRSFTAGAGQDKRNIALVLGRLPGLFVQGENMVVPKGTIVLAKIATDQPPSTLIDDKKNMATTDEL